jgi:RimJ/RimL family protein N-acetyltransferase
MTRTWEHPDLAVFDGHFVTLEPLDPERHIEALFAASNGDEARESVWRYVPSGPFASQEEMQQWMRDPMTGTPHILAWAVVSKEHGEPVGMIGLHSIVSEHGRAEVGHVWLSPKVHRSKINTEMVYLVLRHLFDEKGYRRAEWKCDANNQASRTTAIRMGFTFEARFRQHMWLRGKNRDTEFFAMTDKDWPRCKANFEKWLYTDERVSLWELNNN